jgi:hypothetical protein
MIRRNWRASSGRSPWRKWPDGHASCHGIGGLPEPAFAGSSPEADQKIAAALGGGTATAYQVEGGNVPGFLGAFQKFVRLGKAGAPLVENFNNQTDNSQGVFYVTGIIRPLNDIILKSSMIPATIPPVETKENHRHAIAPFHSPLFRSRIDAVSCDRRMQPPHIRRLGHTRSGVAKFALIALSRRNERADR